MKQFLIRTAVWTLVLLVSLNGLCFGLLYFFGKTHFYKTLYVNNLEPKAYDYVVLGASNGLTTLNTGIIDSAIGTNGFNLSLDDSNPGSQFLMLTHFFAMGNKADYCVLTILNDLDNDKPRINDNDYRFMPLVNRPYVKDYFREMDEGYKPLYLSQFLPLFGVSLYNYEIFYPAIMAMMSPKKRYRFDEHGNYAYPVAKDNKLKTEQKQVKAIDIKNPFYYRIEALCRANGTKLIIYQSPLHDIQVKLNHCQHPFINETDKPFPLEMYRDAIHVNATGMRYCSMNFASTLKPMLMNP